MENEKLTRKQIISIIVGVLTLVVLVASATYAYFSVTAGNSSGTTTIIGDIGGDTIGSVTLTGGNTELYLGVSAYDMSETNKGKIYYSSTEEGSRETSVNAAGKTTYTATLSGDDTDSVMYACDYEFTVTSSGTLLNASSKDDVELVFNGDINKKLTLTGSDKVSGTWYGFKKSNAEREFNAYLQIANKDSNQNSLAGTNLSVEIENTKWNCYLSELDELVGEAYAIVQFDECATWEDSNNDGIKQEYELCMESGEVLTFARSENIINDDDTYNGLEIRKVYTGFEYSNNVPWESHKNNIIKITFEDEIRPVSTANWFSDMWSLTSDLDLTNLNTTLVTNMEKMFNQMFTSINITGIEEFNTSNVTNMSGMFTDIGFFDLDLSNWDVSNVTDMSQMFGGAMGPTPKKLSNWDVSNVTNMSYLFSYVNMSGIGDLSNWDVSNVMNFAYMFLEASGNKDIILETVLGWNFNVNADATDIIAGFDVVFENIDKTKTYPKGFFSGITIQNLDLSNLEITEDFNLDSILHEYSGAYIESFNLSNWDLSNIEDIAVIKTILNKMLNNAADTYISVELNVSNWKLPSDISYMFNSYDGVDLLWRMQGVETWDVSNVTNMSYLFSESGASNINVDLSNWDVSNVTNMSNMFSYSYLTDIGDISGWDVSSVENMDNMFTGIMVNSDFSLNLSGWDVSKVTTHEMFCDNNKITPPIWSTTN